MSKKIAVITPAKFPGTAGDTSNYLEMMAQMRAEGYEVVLICPRLPASEHYEIGIDGLEIVRIPRSPPRLSQLTSHFQIRDFVDAFLFMASESITVFRVLKARKIRHAMMRHSPLTLQLSFLLGFMRVKTVADGELVGEYFEKMNMNKILLALLSVLEKRALKRYFRFKIASMGQSRSLTMSGYHSEKILLAPVAINIEKIPRYNLIEIPEHTFGYFGVLEHWQGVEILVQAFERLLEKLPQARLYIIGEGGMKNQIENTIRVNGLANNIILVGSVNRVTLWREYFKKFRIVVIPRPLHNNSMDFILPIKLVESLAAGKPTIATDIPIMREIPHNAVMLAASGSKEAMTNAMFSLSTNMELMEKHSRAGLLAAEKFDVRDNVKRLLDVLWGED